jgi:uncharacterized linocin/CFP29 family protein
MIPAPPGAVEPDNQKDDDMSDRYLHRTDAPFGAKVWEQIDAAVVAAAAKQYAGRRILHIEGPYGLGLKSAPLADRIAGEKTAPAGVELVGTRSLDLSMVHGHFELAVRDVASFEERGFPLDLAVVIRTAMACARQEDAIVFNGSRELGAEGLLNAKGTLSQKLKPWDKAGIAVDDILLAVNKLDDEGYPGPYTMALAPKLYNQLFRRYPPGHHTEMEHVSQVVADGIVKAEAIKSGGVLLASGAAYATLLLGQDLMTAFVGPDGGNYEFLISESVALRLICPDAICVLE